MIEFGTIKEHPNISNINLSCESCFKRNIVAKMIPKLEPQNP